MALTPYFNPLAGMGPSVSSLGFEYLGLQNAFALEAPNPGIMSVTNENGTGGGGNSVPPGEKQMDAAYSAAGAIVREQLSADQLKVIGGLKDRDVLVISGCYDHIGRTLTAAGIPYIERAAEAVSADLLQASKVVFANCGSTFPENIAERVADFVEAGGLLMSTDYMLKYLLQVAFKDGSGRPLYVEHNGLSIPNTVVDVDWIKEGDPTVQGFFSDGKKPRWWIEASSYPIRVVDPGKVEVLARSSAVGKQWANDPIIVRFAHGKGGVIHLLSHLYLQQGGAAAGQKDESAVAYTTSLGTSMGTVDAVKKATASVGEVGAARMRSAVSSVGFVARTVTGTILGDHPFKQPGATATPGAGTVANMMGATQKRGSAEIGGLQPQNLPWEPTQMAYYFDENGAMNPAPSPLQWNAAAGFYTLVLPDEDLLYIFGRDGGQMQEDVRQRILQLLKARREKNKAIRLMYIPMRDKREQSPISRFHAILGCLGSKTHTVGAIDGDVTVISGDDPAGDEYRQGKQGLKGKSVFVSSGNRIKLAPHIVFRLA